MKRFSLCIILVLLMVSMSLVAMGDDKPTLKFLGRDASHMDLANDPMVEVIEDTLGYKVKYEALPYGDEGMQKLLLLIASGEQYDILKLYPPQYIKLQGQNAVLPLNDLLKKYGDNILDAVSDNSWNKTTDSEGNIYGIPQMSPAAGGIGETILVRMDILNELGLEMPTTIEDFYKVLKIIKDKRPDLIPLTMEGDAVLPSSITSAFGIAGWEDIDGKLVPITKHPNIKEYLKFMKKLYVEGLIDQEFPANKRSSKNEKFTSGKAVMMRYQWWEAPGVFAAIRKNLPDAEVDFLPMLKGENGIQKVYKMAAFEHIICIPKTAEHPEAAMKWMNKFMEPDNFKYIYVGKEGVHHKVENGSYKPIQPAFQSRQSVWWYIPSIIEETTPTLWQARLRKNDDLYNAYVKMKKLGEGFAENNPIVFAPPSEAEGKYAQVLDEYSSDEFIKFIVDAKKLEKYNDFIKKWESKGGTELENAYNEWYQNK